MAGAAGLEPGGRRIEPVPDKVNNS